MSLTLKCEILRYNTEDLNRGAFEVFFCSLYPSSFHRLFMFSLFSVGDFLRLWHAMSPPSHLPGSLRIICVSISYVICPPAYLPTYLLTLCMCVGVVTSWETGCSWLVILVGDCSISIGGDFLFFSACSSFPEGNVWSSPWG